MIENLLFIENSFGNSCQFAIKIELRCPILKPLEYKWTKTKKQKNCCASADVHRMHFFGLRQVWVWVWAQERDQPSTQCSTESKECRINANSSRSKNSSLTLQKIQCANVINSKCTIYLYAQQSQILTKLHYVLDVLHTVFALWKADEQTKMKTKTKTKDS